MSPAAIIALMLTLMPSAPRERITPIAEAISTAARSREEAAWLTTISYYENGFGRAGAAFGACSYLCAHRCGRCRQDVPLVDVARWSLALLRRTDRDCGPSPSVAVRLGRYHTGRCRADSFSEREAVCVSNLLSRAASNRSAER